jgi:hypothetical protein
VNRGGMDNRKRLPREVPRRGHGALLPAGYTGLLCDALCYAILVARGVHTGYRDQQMPVRPRRKF